MTILAELTSDDVLDTAYDWVCSRRRDYPADADVLSFRQGWARKFGQSGKLWTVNFVLYRA